MDGMQQVKQIVSRRELTRPIIWEILLIAGSLFDLLPESSDFQLRVTENIYLFDVIRSELYMKSRQIELTFFLPQSKPLIKLSGQ